MFGLNRGQSTQPTDADIYQESLAVWQIEHDANSHDLTIAQCDRFRWFVKAEGMGSDGQHLLYARWLIQTGRCTDATR